MTAADTRFSIRGKSFDAPPLAAGLYVVSTPIGNLGDMTLRALETLAASTVIACEDTRTSGILLKHYGIASPKISYTEHNAAKRGPDLVRQIENGASVSLISDAGTPLVSDPGQRLVQAVVDAQLPVVAVPGASAPLTALVASGLPCENFRFVGFSPTRTQQRARFMAELADEPATLLFFESPARIAQMLEAAAGAFGAGRRACVARELTKLHETMYRGTLGDLAAEFAAMDRVRGEIVVAIAGAAAKSTDPEEADNLLKQALETMKPGQAAGEVARMTGLSRQDLYRRALALK